jgi:chromosome segregation and condensation protein ScpB
VPDSAAERIEAVLRAAEAPLSIDEICDAAFERRGARERNIVRVTMHRLDARGLLQKHPRTYSLKPA